MLTNIKIIDNCKRNNNIKSSYSKSKVNMASIPLRIIKFIVLLLLLPLISPFQSRDFYKTSFKNKGNCYLIDNHYLNKFNLKKINNVTLIVSDQVDHQVSEKILINFCQDVYSNKLTSNEASLLKIIKANNEIETWYNYSYDSKTWEFDSKSDSLLIKLTTNKKCNLWKNDTKLINSSIDNENPNLILSVTLNITCNYNLAETVKITSTDDNEYLADFIENQSECKKTLHFQSKLICPMNSGLYLHRFYSKYSFIFGLFNIILGFFMLTYGNSFEKTTFYLNGILFSRMLIAYIEDFSLYNFFDNGKDFAQCEWLLWLIEALSVLIGIFIGYFIKNFRQAKILFLGSMTGHVVFYLVWLPLCFFIRFYPSIFYFFFHVISFALTGLISYKCLCNSKSFLIVSCAVIGSYNTVKVIKII